jgi:hypothetical protein
MGIRRTFGASAAANSRQEKVVGPPGAEAPGKPGGLDAVVGFGQLGGPGDDRLLLWSHWEIMAG